MRRIAILNQKGGVGKTTTTVNLAAALALAGQRVCVLDLDPQAHASTHLGVEPDGRHPTIYDVLTGQRPLAAVRRNIDLRLELVPADIHLAAAEVELAGVVGREVILKEALLGEAASFDYLLMDCGPSLGILTLNALAAADEVFIPLQPHYFALHGFSKLLETTALVARRINPALRVSGIVICLYDGTRLAQEVVQDVAAFLERARHQGVPWANARIFRTKIRRNVRLAECPSFGRPIFAYAPRSPGAQDYAALAAEVLAMCGNTSARGSETPAVVDGSFLVSVIHEGEPATTAEPAAPAVNSALIVTGRPAPSMAADAPVTPPTTERLLPAGSV